MAGRRSNASTARIREWIGCLFLAGLSAGAWASPVEVVLPPNAEPLEQLAASEMARYVNRLFGVRAEVVVSPSGDAEHFFLVGVADRHPEQAARPALTDQGFLLRTTAFRDKPAVTVAGGSPAAALWGVYELAERYGVRFLLHGDVLPPQRSGVFLPEIDRVFEPAFRARWFKTMGDFAIGTEGWGLDDYRPLIDQLAKLKFNRIRVSSSPSQPFLDFQFRGVPRKTAVLWYGERFPITDDMPGRGLFGAVTEFWNPDLPPADAGYAELVAAGERHMHGLIAYARSRGIEASFVGSSLTDFSKDFREVVPDARTVNQLGELTVAPGPSVPPDNAVLAEIAGALVRTEIERFPDVASYGFPVGTEWPSWIDAHESAWNELDRRYGVQAVVSLDEVLRRAGGRIAYHEGAANPVMEVKGQIAGLCFLTRLWNSPEVLPKTSKPDARLVVYELAQELYPILPRVLPSNSELVIVVDYNPTRVLRKRDFFRQLPAKAIPTTLVLTLHDDSVGVLPQLTTGSLHQLVGDMRRFGVNGFCTRQWLIADHDPCVAYLSKASWYPDTTPEAVYADQVRSICGPDAVEPMLEAFRQVEAVTAALEDHGMALTFPARNMMLRQWDPAPMDANLVKDRETYRLALAAVRKIPEPHRNEAKAYVGYWAGRLAFAVAWFDAIDAVHQAAASEKAARDAQAEGDPGTYRRCLDAAARKADAAHAATRQAIDHFAAVARDRADLGAIATLAEYAYRPLKRKAESLRAEYEAAGN